jgi:competence ComEA-like helix-hairpin-helix protein
MRERRRLRFPDVTPKRPWWRKWQTWLPVAITVVGLASATVWLIRDVSYLLPDFGPKKGSLVVNINTATEKELQTVPGIGPARAAQIVAGRPWKSVDGLTRIRGIGRNQIEEMRPFLTVNGETRERPDP